MKRIGALRASENLKDRPLTVPNFSFPSRDG